MLCFRLVTGLLIDHVSFRKLMPFIGILLTVVLSALVIAAKTSLAGFVFCLLLCYFLVFAHNTVVPIQTAKLFDNCNVVIGAIGVSNTFGFFILDFLNQFVLTKSEDINSLFGFFLVLAGFAGASVVVTALVPETPKKKSPEEEWLLGTNSSLKV